MKDKLPSELHQLLIHIPDTIAYLTPDLYFLDATDDYLSVMMKQRDEIIGKHVFEVFPDHETAINSVNRKKVRKCLEAAAETKQGQFLSALRYDMRKEDGVFGERYWEVKAKPVLDRAGNVQYLVFKPNDVTEREISKQALISEENKYRFLLNSLPQLIYTTDAAGSPTFFNQRWYTYTGSTAELLGNDNWGSYIHPDDLAKVKEKSKYAIENGTEFQAELRIKNTQGTYRWFLTRSTPMRDQSGEIITRVGSSVDIQATRELVQELEQSYQQLSDMSDQVMEGYRKAESERKTLHNLIMKAPVFFCVLRGPEHRYELMNEQYQKLFPNRDLIGQSVAEALPEVAEQGFVKVLDGVYATGKEYIAECISVKLDRYGNGKLEDMTLTFMYQTIYDENNKPSGIMVCGFNVGEQVRSTNK